MSRETLEQSRAKDAWDRSEGCSKEYMNLAKSLPALIMNSGLMQVMAFLHEKDSSKNSRGRDGGHRDPAFLREKDSGKNSPHGQLGKHLREWLHSRFPKVGSDFEGFMQYMMQADPQTYQDVTAEAFAWLRWMRQMAAARQKGN